MSNFKNTNSKKPDFREQLGQWTARHSSWEILPHLNNIGEDGIDHININPLAATDLGRALDAGADMPFTHSKLGSFKCMEALACWLRSPNPSPRLRTAVGQAAIAALRPTNSGEIPDFKYIYADATWEKINAYPGLIAEIKESELHFDNYYVDARRGGQTSRRTASDWTVAMFEEIRKALKEDRAPDFEFLKDNEDFRRSLNLKHKYAAPSTQVASLLQSPEGVAAKKRKKKKKAKNTTERGMTNVVFLTDESGLQPQFEKTTDTISNDVTDANTEEEFGQSSEQTGQPQTGVSDTTGHIVSDLTTAIGLSTINSVDKTNTEIVMSCDSLITPIKGPNITSIFESNLLKIDASLKENGFVVPAPSEDFAK